MAPDESPVAYTRSAFAPYLVIVYFTIWATACVSPPPSWVSDAFDPTSQHLAEVAAFVVCGKTMRTPSLPAPARMPPACPKTAEALLPQKCETTRMGGFVAGLSGT